MRIPQSPDYIDVFGEGDFFKHLPFLELQYVRDYVGGRSGFEKKPSSCLNATQLKTSVVLLRCIWPSDLTERPAPRVGFLVLLKTFQRLGYFPQLADVPLAITTHIAKQAGYERLPAGVASYDEGNARVRHMARILTSLRVTPYGPAAEAAMTSAIVAAAATKDDVADIINVAIEELVRQRYELPGFTILLRAAKKTRANVSIELMIRGCSSGD